MIQGYILNFASSTLITSTYTWNGCDGGNPWDAYFYVMTVGGITFDDFYPYDINTAGICDKTKNDYTVTVTGIYAVEGETNMMNHVLSGRTLSAAVDATQLQSYRSGILSNCGRETNHAMQLVGVNVDEGYWIIRNSWGTWWGENGYGKLLLVRNE